MDKFLSGLKGAADDTAKKTRDLVEQTRIKMAISDTKGQIKLKYETLGVCVYRASKDLPMEGCSPEQVIAEIDALEEHIRSLEAQIAVLAGKRFCPNCGASCSMEAAFCNSCGQKLS